MKILAVVIVAVLVLYGIWAVVHYIRVETVPHLSDYLRRTRRRPNSSRENASAPIEDR